MLSRALTNRAFLAKPTMARAFGYKIKVDNPVVDMDGDEMTKIIWQWIKDRVSIQIIIYPNGNANRFYFELSPAITYLDVNMIFSSSAYSPLP